MAVQKEEIAAAEQKLKADEKAVDELKSNVEAGN
jgi:hypothetical protein